MNYTAIRNPIKIISVGVKLRKNKTETEATLGRLATYLCLDQANIVRFRVEGKENKFCFLNFWKEFLCLNLRFWTLNFEFWKFTSLFLMRENKSCLIIYLQTRWYHKNLVMHNRQKTFKTIWLEAWLILSKQKRTTQQNEKKL